MTKNDFLTSAQPIAVSVGGLSQQLAPRRFSTGSVGYNLSGRIPLAPGTAAIPVTVNGFPFEAGPTKPKEGKKRGFYAGGNIKFGGQKFSVGANITDNGDGKAIVTVNVTAANSKQWEEGSSTNPASPAVAPATAPLTAPAVPAPAPAEEESVTFLEAKKRAAAALKMPFEKVTDRMVNRFANGQNLTIAG